MFLTSAVICFHCFYSCVTIAAIPCRCPQVSDFLLDTFSRFLEHDEQVSHGNARKVWPSLLDSMYPCLKGYHLVIKLSLICQRAFSNRLDTTLNNCRKQFLELWCGVGNLSRELLRAGFAGGALDIVHSEMHNCLNSCGLRLWIDLLMSLDENGLLWLGPPCSSFVVLRLAQSQRCQENNWLGDVARTFVQVGNCFMEIASLLYLMACCCGNMVCLEQPGNSCMVKCPQLRSVLSFVGAHRVKTYLGAFAGPTSKPLQIWTNRKCFSQLSRDCPPKLQLPGESLVTRGPDGSFTGKKDLLEESGVYTAQFGTAVAQVFSQELSWLSCQ